MKKTVSDFFDYLLWRGDLSFDESPFNEIDGLILSSIIYLNFESILTESFNDSKLLCQVNDEFINHIDYELRCNMGAMINPLTPDLLKACAIVRRFKNIKLCGYKIIFDKEKEEQFGALTYLLDDKKKTKVVVFQGTDDSILGWKEDFNISFTEVIPTQEDSLKYFEEACKKFKRRIILAGHSKGGNAALYCALNAKKSCLKKILCIYNYDGPGFKKEIIESQKFLEIKSRLKSFYPAFCIIGTLFYHDSEFTIIKSNHKSLMQHDPLSWGVEGNHFIQEEEFAKESGYISEIVNRWIEDLPVEEKKTFVNAFFDVLDATGETMLDGLTKTPVTIVTKIVGAMTKTPAAQKKLILQMVKVFMSFGKDELPSLFNSESKKTKKIPSKEKIKQ